MGEKKTLTDLVNQFSDEVESLLDFEQETDRAVLVIAVDRGADRGKVRAFGSKQLIELGIYELLSREEMREVRHRLTSALSLKMAREIQAEANAIVPQVALEIFKSINELEQK